MQRDTHFEPVARQTPAAHGVAGELAPPSQYPQRTRTTDGLWSVLLSAADNEQTLVGWTQGFSPGLFWYLFRYTQNPIWRRPARSRPATTRASPRTRASRCPSA